MHVKQLLRPSPFVKAINILGDQQELSHESALERGKSDVGGVRGDSTSEERLAPGIVEGQHLVRPLGECFRSRKVLWAKALPET